MKRIIVEIIYLIAVEAIEKSDADDRSSDARVMGERGKGQRFHFHVDYVLIVDLVKKVQFLLFGVITKGAIQSPLAYYFANPSSLFRVFIIFKDIPS